MSTAVPESLPSDRIAYRFNKISIMKPSSFASSSSPTFEEFEILDAAYSSQTDELSTIVDKEAVFSQPLRSGELPPSIFPTFSDTLSPSALRASASGTSTPSTSKHVVFAEPIASTSSSQPVQVAPPPTPSTPSRGPSPAAATIPKPPPNYAPIVTPYTLSQKQSGVVLNMNLRHIRSALGLPPPKRVVETEEPIIQPEIKAELPQPVMQLQYPEPEAEPRASPEPAFPQPPTESAQPLVESVQAEPDPDEGESSHVEEEDMMDVDSADEFGSQDVVMDDAASESESEPEEELHSSLFTPEPASQDAHEAVAPVVVPLKPRTPTPPPPTPIIKVEAPPKQKKSPQAPASSSLFIPKKKIHAPKPSRTSSQIARLQAGRSRSRSPMPGSARSKNWAMTARRSNAAANQPRPPPSAEVVSRPKGPGRPRKVSLENYAIQTDVVAKHPEPKACQNGLLTKLADNLQAGLVDLAKAMSLDDGEEYRRRCTAAVERAASPFEVIHSGMHSIRLDFLKGRPELLSVLKHVAERKQVGKAMPEEVFEFKKRVKDMNKVFRERFQQVTTY
ncbi:hypothetical protein EIP91_011141 [Steccherinum ochraceum]|uniref:Uncharacterized protein n=1 Tax=Steccherinum ochraceum TaxID=92696 RepID=A0A4R0RR50_9APHY|nr:hypothetical protein EIP91_011141 [Steccherinum ochraceum]